MAHQPVGTGSSIVVSVGAGHARTSGVISHMSDTLRVAIVGDSDLQGAHVAISKSEFSPAADATDFLVLKDKPATINIFRPSSQRVVGITTGATTLIDFPEGTGSPFGVNDMVTLRVDGQPYFEASVGFSTVTKVWNGSGRNGYYSTRITVNADTSGIKTDYVSTNWAELRSSFKVSSFGIGLGAKTGALYFQQVQITGEG